MSIPATIRLVTARGARLTATPDNRRVPIDLARLASVVPHEGEVVLPPGVDRAEIEAAGVRVQQTITLYSSRKEAHDWLAGRAGAWREAMLELQAAVEHAAPVVVEIVLTRPSLPQLPELAEILGRMRVPRVVFRLPLGAEVAGDRAVMLLPRAGPAATAIDAAAARLERSRVSCVAENFPQCGPPLATRRRIIPVYEAETLAAVKPRRCATCDPMQCSGSGQAYIEAFGWVDLEQRPDAIDSVVVSIRMDVPSRAIRMRLTRAAMTRAKTLRVVGDSFAHRDAPSLLRDAAHLAFERVEVAGDVRATAAFTDGQIARLAGITRVDLPLHEPRMDGELARAVHRLRELAQVEAHPFAVLSDRSALPAFVEAWASGALPGEPRFRFLQPLDSEALVEIMATVADARCRDAIARLLPRCCYGDAGARPVREWESAERFEPSFRHDCADPVGDAVRCTRCDPMSPRRGMQL